MASDCRNQVVSQHLHHQPAFDMETNHNTDDDAEISALLEDNKELQKHFDDLQMYYFHLQKQTLPQPKNFASRKTSMIHKQANSLGNLDRVGERTKLENILSCYLRYTGIMVKTYSSDTCIVLYDVNVAGKSRAQFAIHLSKISEPDTWILKKYHLPLGICLSKIEKMYEPMTPEYILEIQKTLNAQYNRLWQINQTQEILPESAHLVHSSNGCYVELLLKLKSQGDEGEILTIQCLLIYDALKIRPSDIQISCLGINEGKDLDVLKTQIKPLQLFRLHDAFRFSFQNPENLYVCFTKQELISHEKKKHTNGNNIRGDNQWMNKTCSDDEKFPRNNERLVNRGDELKMSNAKNKNLEYEQISSDSEFEEYDSVSEDAPKNTKKGSNMKNCHDDSLDLSEGEQIKRNMKRNTKTYKGPKGKKFMNNQSVNTTVEEDQSIPRPRGRPPGSKSKLIKGSK